MFENKDDTILARWVEGRLTPEELEEFQKSPEFAEYKQIVNGMAHFKKPEFDKKALLDKIMGEVEQPKKGKIIQLKPLFYSVAVAASIILIIGIFFNKIKYTTQIGQQMTVTLPDGSEVQLNAQSQLIHNRFFWKNNKSVELNGEGFFKVKKGKDFSVETPSGTVSVLGTEFNIKYRNTTFELTCYEGSVQFNTAKTNKITILKKGDAIKLVESNIEKTTTDEEEPTWTKGVSTFVNVSINDVIHELEIQYGIKVQGNIESNTNHFTGSFVHDNLMIALKTVFIPLGIKYELSNDKKTVTLKSS